MKILRSLTVIKSETSVALGFFDGVHMGHKAVICEAVSRARRLGAMSAVFTFAQRPKSVLKKEKAELILSESEKISILDEMGVDLLFIIDFEDVMNLSGEDFVTEVLSKKLKAREIVCGYNYYFGRGGKNGYTELCRLCEPMKISVTEQQPIMFNDLPISSSRIRECLKQGKINDVNRMLGRSYGYNLDVVHGNMLGRTIDAPTINQEFSENMLIPRFGVYASCVTVDGEKYRGVTNIGIKPTVGAEKPLSETHIIGYKGEELYGKTVDVRLLDYIRDEKKFESIELLKEQIEADRQAVINLNFR